MYKDEAKTELIEYIEFGQVKAGKVKDIIVYLENESKRELVRLKYKIKGPGKLTKSVTVMQAPASMLPLSIVPIMLRWSPDLDLKMGLKVKLKITGEIIFRGE